MTYQFKIQLKGYKNPEIWRQIDVPANYTFYQFHKVLEIAFGKAVKESFYSFSPSGKGSKPQIMSIPRLFPDTKYAKSTVLSTIFEHRGKSFVYIPDYEETNLHSIVLEHRDNKVAPYARCLAGEGAYPPDTCAGPDDYEAMKQILSDKNHPQHESIREWLELNDGETWEEKYKIDFSKVNEQLALMDSEIKAFRKYTLINYDIFDESYGLNPFIWKELDKKKNEIYEGINVNENIRELKILIDKYPTIPHLKNTLAAAYKLKGEINLFLEITFQVMSDYPNYVMARCNLINHYIEEEKFDKASELLGKNFDLNELYPNRNGDYSVVEIMNYHLAVIRYLIIVEDYEEGENHFNYLEYLVPNSLDLEKMRLPLILLRMNKTMKNSEEEKRIAVIPEKIPSTNRKPDFENPETWVFYQYDYRIKLDFLHRILALPRESVIRDMEKILIDSIARIKYIKDNSDSNTSFAPVHALTVLSALEAEEALETLFKVLRQDTYYYDFWYDLILTEEFWRYIYMMGKNRLDRLRDLVCEPNRYSYVRTAISIAVKYVAVYQPERRDEVINWYEQVILYLLDNQNDANIFEQFVYTSLFEDLLDIAGREHFPLIFRLYDVNLTDKKECITLHEVKKRLSKPLSKSIYREIFISIHAYYDRWKKFFNHYKSDSGKKNKNSDISASDQSNDKQEKKIGRNDVCPCGSGKKYKKCCGSNQ